MNSLCVYSIFAFIVIAFAIATIATVTVLKDLLGTKAGKKLIKVAVVLYVIHVIVGSIILYCTAKPTP